MNVKVQIANVKSSPNCKTQMNVTLNLFRVYLAMVAYREGKR